MAKKILAGTLSLILVLILSACGGEAPVQQDSASAPETASADGAAQSSGILGIGTRQEEETMQITVRSENGEIVYELNGSKAAESLYEQLPLTAEQQDFGSNEKTFYPPEKLEVSDTPYAQGGEGVLAYYEPWGDVVMFYGDFEENSGLYELGRAVSGQENIAQLSGTIEIVKTE